MRVLLVEDELRMAAAISRALRVEGIVTDVAQTGTRGVAMAHGEQYDVLILDVMLPGLRRGRDVPAAAARRGVGPDHHAHRPRRDRGPRPRAGPGRRRLPDQAVLAGRAARPAPALARRGPVARPTVLEVGDLRLDPATRQVWRGDVEVMLSAREFLLLETFMRRPARCSATCSSSTRLGPRLRAALQRRRGVRPVPPGEDRPAVRGQVARDGPRVRLPAARDGGA